MTRRPATEGGHPDRSFHVLYTAAGVATAAFIPFFALFLQGRGFPPDQIGLVLAGSSLAGVLANPLWGNAADTRLGTLRTLRFSSVAAAGAALALMVTGSAFWATLAVAAALGAATGPGTGLADTLALVHLGPERSSQYGTIRLWASLGWAVAALVFGAVFQWGALAWMPVVYSTCLVLYLSATLPLSGPGPHPGTHASRIGTAVRAFRASPRLLPFLGGLLLVSIATQGAWGFLPLRIAAKGGGALLVGVAASLPAFVEIPFMRASARLGTRVPLRTVYVGGAAVYVALMLTWTLVANPVGIALATTVRGAGFALTYVSMVLIAGRLVPKELRTTGQVLMQTTAMGLGPILGAAIGGVVYARLGARALFAGAAVLTVVGAVVVWNALSSPAFARPQAREEEIV